jgi:hypothetical protein
MEMTRSELQAKATEVLREAAALIEQGWCQKYAARDAFGNETLINDGDDVEWCALGAIDCAADRLTSEIADEFQIGNRLQLVKSAETRLCKVVKVEGIGAIVQWNDARDRTAEEVAAALREAAGTK